MVSSTATGMNPPAQCGIIGGGALPLATLNHVSLVCRSVASSLAFYRDVLGFVSVRRPGSFDFHGAWLFNYGIGIHLLQAEDPESLPPKKKEINPKDNHISFTCSSLEEVQRRLKEMGVGYVQRRVEEGGIYVDQVFFHDPDGFMIEVCTCDKLPVVPLDATPISARTPPPATPTLACKRAPATKGSASGYVGEVIDVASNGAAIPAAGGGCTMRTCSGKLF